MIEKMMMVHIVSAFSEKEQMLKDLRKLGVMHISEKKSAEKAVSDRFLLLSKTVQALGDYLPKKYDDPGVQSDEEFNTMFAEVRSAIEQKSELSQKVSDATAEIERIQAWGEFSPEELKTISDAGFDFHFYRLENKAYDTVASDDSIRFVKLASVEKMQTIAVLGKLPAEISATEFALPTQSAGELQKYVEDCNTELARCNQVLEHAAVYQKSFNAQLAKAQNDEEFSAAGESVQGESDLVWISGYVPEAELDSFKTAAAQNKWAWAIDNVDAADENVPTKVRYNKVSKLIKPVFDILGILPGYREQDISIWFFLFFILFFAMIIGDAGYGFLILLGTIGFTVKSKKFGDAQFLLVVLSVGTIVWGAITGTWFGMEKAMSVPLLKALVVPEFANYPEYFGVTTAAQQNTVMKFSFSIGAIHMLLGTLLSIKKKVSEKNLSFIADIGWMIAVAAMYMLSLYLVIGVKLRVAPIFVAVGVAFVLVVLFGGMSPEKSFGAGLKSGLADAFTVFLNTISCFGNVMSYIRLFAVGMAGLAIAQSFNNMASGFNGPLIIIGAVIVLIGHALNIVMAFLSVVVHGVRLNVLEFSGQVGMEWTGIAYEPFEEKIESK